MSLVAKLFELWLAGESLMIPKAYLSDLVKGLASILVLVAVSMIFGFLASISIYAMLYLFMTLNGLTPLASFGILLGVTLLGLALCLLALRDHWKKFRGSPALAPRPRSFVGESSHKIMDAFMDGFSSGRTAPSR
jgi:hypothetical protein